MISTPPLDTNTTLNAPAASSEASRMSDAAADPARKDILLRLYLDRVIRQNEAAGVTTGVNVAKGPAGQPLKTHNLDTEQFAASVNKLPIARLVLNDLLAQKLQPDQVLKWTATDVRPGSGTYDKEGAPTQATVRELLFDMLNPSGNTAVRVFVNQAFGGAAAVNARFKGELQLKNTYLQPQSGTSFFVGNTTPREAMANIRGLLAGQDTYTAFVKDALATNIYGDYGVRSQLAGNDYIVLSNKVGILDDPAGNNRHDVGIIYNTKAGTSVAYAFMNTAKGAAYNTPTAQAGVSLADMGRGVLRYAGDKAVHGERALTGDAPSAEQRYRY